MQISYGVRWTKTGLQIMRGGARDRPSAYRLACDRGPDVAKNDLTHVLSAMAADLSTGRAVVVAGMPVAETAAEWIRAPFTSRAKARKVLPTLLDIRLPFPVEDCEYRFPEEERDNEGIRALTAAVRKAALEQRMQSLADLGIDPVWVEYEGFALWGLSIRTEPPPSNEPRVLAHLGPGGAVVILGRGDVFHSAFTCRFDPADPPEELAHRIERNLRAREDWDHTGRVHWYWAGPAADDEALVGRVEQAVQSFMAPVFNRHHDPAHFAVRALTWSAFAADVPSVNFREGAGAHPVQRMWERRSRRGWLSRLAAASLLLIAMNIGWRALMDREHHRVQAALTAAAREMTGLPNPPRGQEVLVVNQHVDERMDYAGPLLRMFKPSLREDLHRLLLEAIRRDMLFEKMALSDRRVLIQGTAADWDQPAELAAQLRARGYNVSEPDRKDAGADERVRFTIQGGRGDG